MVYLFFCLFIFYLIVDYVYLYTFLDSKFFMNKSGSKLNHMLNLKKDQCISKKKYISFKITKERIKHIGALLIFACIMNIIACILFKNIIFSQFVIIDLGYKKIELVSTFEEYWNSFLKIYHLSYNLFLYIIFKKLWTSYNYEKNSRISKQKEDKEYDGQIYIGKNEQEKVYLRKEELYKNLLITGSIGTGKTSSAINKFCKYMIDNKVSGLIIDIKGNYVDTVKSFLKGRSGPQLVVISEESMARYNPIKSGVRCMEMANRLRRVLELVSVSNTSDSYWLDKAENVIFNFLILIKYVDSSKLCLLEIHTLATDDEYLKKTIELLKAKGISNIKDERAAHEINNVLMFFSKEYFNLDSRVISIIKSEITRLTIPFITEYDICDRYGVEHETSIDISFEENCPKIYVLSINMSRNFLLAKMLATFIKLEFQSCVLENIQKPLELFCICDEYQEFSNTADAHFLSLSREAKCMNIYSMQSYSSLINILKNEQASKVIIQNMVNKIWFRNDDNYTVSEILKQIGKEKKILMTNTLSEGASETKKSILRGFRNNKSSISESISYVENNDYIYESNIITRDLKTFEALVLFEDKGKMNNVKRICLMEEKEI